MGITIKGGTSIKNKSIVTDGLVFYVDAGNANSYPGSGTTWTDLKSGSVTSTLTNGPTYSSSNGGSIVFDGTNDYSTNATLNITDYSSFTLEAWVNPDNSSSDHSIMGQWLNDGVDGPVIFYLDVDGAAVGYDIVVRCADNNIRRVSTDIANGTIGAWNHVACTFDSTSLKLYVNNSLIGTTSTASALKVNSNDGFAIGSDRTTGSRYWDGKIASVKIYNRVLSATEVAQNYNAHTNRFI